MAVKPKLAMIPSGYKGGASSGDLYSVLPSDGTGDFDFSRSGSATRINKDGLIETVASNVPRLNYPLIDGVVSGCPSLLLEPERRNLIQYSEDFSQSYWTKRRATITSNQIISPDGTLNADLLTIEDGSIENYVETSVLTVNGSKQTVSFFVKKGTNNFAHTLLWDTSSNGSRQWFDLENGIVGSSTSFGSGISVSSASIESYGNGWYRCVVVFNSSFSSVITRVSASNGDGQTNGTIGKTIYIWGYQCEGNSSYATSYIPNYGTSAGVTRSAETCNGAGDASTFNDSEGVLYAEMSALDNDSDTKRISLSDGTSSNRISLLLSDETIGGVVVSGSGVAVNVTVSGYDATLNNKILFKYKENDFSIFVNGFEVLTDTSGITPTGLNELRFDNGYSGNDFYGNTKQLQYFNTALTDAELEKLTSYDSFRDMAIAGQYKTY